MIRTTPRLCWQVARAVVALGSAPARLRLHDLAQEDVDASRLARLAFDVEQSGRFDELAPDPFKYTIAARELTA